MPLTRILAPAAAVQLLGSSLLEGQDFTRIAYVTALEALGIYAVFIAVFEQIAFTAPWTTLEMVHLSFSSKR
jgi:hypothetical protein